MLGLADLKQTKVYREALAEGREEGILEGKLQVVPALLQRGLSVADIAAALDLTETQVRQAASR